MEAGLRQYKDINSPYPSGSSPLDPLVTRPIAIQTATQPAMNPDQPSGSEAAEPQRKAATGKNIHPSGHRTEKADVQKKKRKSFKFAS